MFTLCLIHTIMATAFALGATVQVPPPFRYQPDKITRGTVYHYEKSNVDGTHRSIISLYVASNNRLESFKWHEGSTQADLVVAEIDWELYSVRRFESWQVFADGERILRATMDYVDSLSSVHVSAGGHEETVKIEYLPWHSYDFDFASLNFSFRHLQDPEKTFAIGIADVDHSDASPRFVFKGLAEVSYEDDEIRHGAKCRRYRVDGPGLKNRGGRIWVSSDGDHIVDYEIDLPDEPGFTSGKLKLKHIETLDWKQWDEFIRDKLAAPRNE